MARAKQAKKRSSKGKKKSSSAEEEDDSGSLSDSRSSGFLTNDSTGEPAGRHAATPKKLHRKLQVQRRRLQENPQAERKSKSRRLLLKVGKLISRPQPNRLENSDTVLERLRSAKSDNTRKPQVI